uniref:Uncharacterized protein n=1 Tax=Setaria italica TaxID=4555 RepID=K4A3S0_SETIT
MVLKCTQICRQIQVYVAYSCICLSTREISRNPFSTYK